MTLAKIKKIEPRTLRFIEAYKILEAENKLPSNVELTGILGIKSKSTISEILSKRQNIQPQAWAKFIDHFKIKDENSSEISVSRDTLLNALVTKLISLSETTNTILERQEKDIVQKVDRIDSNLSLVTAQAEKLQYEVESGRHVVLQSLSRLEGKKPDHLLNEADSIKISLSAQADKLYRKTVKDKVNTGKRQ